MKFSIDKIKFTRIVFLVIGIACFALNLQAQEIQTQETDSVIVIHPEPEEFNVSDEDAIVVNLSDSIIVESVPEDIGTLEIDENEAFLVADSVFTEGLPAIPAAISQFKPNSTRAMIYSAILPGLGQIYNQKYWKLPLVYGGFMGFIYAITWNNTMYKDYYNAYMGIMDDFANRLDQDPATWSDDWKDLVNPDLIESRIGDTNFHNLLKRRKDYYRRYRDLSIILAVGFYFICMIDAYVDAELFDFDISPDLSFRIQPLISPQSVASSRSFGLNLSITF